MTQTTSPDATLDATLDATPDATAEATSLDDARWRAMADKALNGLDPFVIAVRTTGIFCRLGCPARTPHRRNVQFFDAIDDAREAGFRACKRCHPDNGVLSPWRSLRQIRDDSRDTLTA